MKFLTLNKHILKSVAKINKTNDKKNLINKKNK